ncbi:hypothetical protein EJ04DRAFT_506445 [Polyplosphaeria fusca]|uniref:NB-ARC domain-containing protein n=1 Tax=Polyplosphaeria fusca TaxID=682080 RepID=A0A9P4QIM0_9PLEO|nr:hypothetical protein EJ04DRAFT_506445 [Polyplosphaeria fusca]
MADPLSIIASTVQIGDVCVRLAKFLYEAGKGIQTIDKELISLSKDVTSLQTINEAVRVHFEADIRASQKAFEAESSSHVAASNLWVAFDGKLRDCRTTLEELDDICSRIEGDSSKSTSVPDVVQRSARWFRKYFKEEQLAKYRQKISGHHDSLQLLLTAANIIHTRNLQSTSAESIALIRTLRSELRKGILSLQEGISTRNEAPSPVIQSAQAVIPLAYINEHFSLPQAVSSTFIGRDVELDTLTDAMFQQETRHFQQKRFVVHGLGGAGKSQFCSKWAQDNRHRFWGVFWIDATSLQSAKKSFAEIARLGKVDANERAAKAWLSSKDRPWLLIIDNADDPALPIEQYFPEGERGIILVTTRNFQLRTHGTVGPEYFHFKELDSKASTDLLLRTAGERAPWSTGSLEFAAKICQKLGFLPLAIIHAGKAILRHVCSLQTYIAYFDQSWTHVRDVRRKRRLSETNITVFSSYELAFQGLLKRESQTCEDAIELLKTFAFLHCQRIRVDTLIQASTNPILEAQAAKERQAHVPKRNGRPRKPLPKKAKEFVQSIVVGIMRLGEVPVLPKVLRDVDRHGDFNEIRLREALSELHQMSLLEYDPSDDSYSMHPLIHVWVRERPQMTLAEQAVWCQAAGTVLAHAVIIPISPPLGSRESDENLRRDILPHVDHVQKQERKIADQITRNQSLSKRWWRFWPVFSGGMARGQIAQLAKFGLVYAHNGLFHEALKQQKIVADFLCERLGKDNPITVRLLLLMSDIHWALTEGDKASDLLEDLLKHCIESLGRDHEDTVRVLEKLGNTRWQQSRFTEAREMLGEVVQKLTQLHGTKHPDTLRATSNYGRAVAKFFEFDKALKLHTQALEGLEKDADYERSHTDILTVLDYLAMAYFDRYYYAVEGDRADLDRAHELETEVVAGRRKKLGKEHGFTLWAMLNLARIKAARGEEGDLATAEKLIRDGIKIAIRNLEENHLGILYGKAQLANILMASGRLADAESLLLDVDGAYKKTFGGHADQMVSMAFLVGCYQRQGKMSEAAVMREKLMEGTHKIFGDEAGPWEDFFVRKYGKRSEVIIRHDTLLD